MKLKLQYKIEIKCTLDFPDLQTYIGSMLFGEMEQSALE